MALNVYKVKKYGALGICAFIPTVMFLFGIQGFTFFEALGLFFLGLIVSVVIANKMLTNPLTDMLEGKGLLVLGLDSTGVIAPFIARVNEPYIEAEFKKKGIFDIFDRKLIHYLRPPRHVNAVKEFDVTKKIKDKEGKEVDQKGNFLTIHLPEKQEAKSMFAFLHWPVLIYNKNLESFITKEMLEEKEALVFKEHLVLYLLKKVENLTNYVRDFARHVIEQSKPGLLGKLFGGGALFWVVVIIVIIVVGSLLFPLLLDAFTAMQGG